MTRIPVHGIHLNVETRGDGGETLVLLHGFTGSTQTWEPFMSALGGETRTAVAIDLLGHGRSDSPADPARYRIERAIDDLSALFDRLGFERVDLLGYSMGGRIALHLALSMPERIGTLILESTSPGIDGPDERAERVRQDEALAQMLEREGLERFVDYWEAQSLFASQEQKLDPTTRLRLRQQRLAGNPVGLVGSLRGLGAGVPEPLFVRLRQAAGFSPGSTPEGGAGRAATVGWPLRHGVNEAGEDGHGRSRPLRHGAGGGAGRAVHPEGTRGWPVRRALLIAGELDHKYRRLAELMGSAIPNVTVAIVPGAGHAVHLEQPEVFQQLVLKHLTSPAGAAVSS